MSQVLITFAYSSFLFFSKSLPCHTWRLFYLFYAKQYSVNPFMYYAQKLPNTLLKSCGITPQDLKSMFGHFSISYMKELTCFFNKKEQTHFVLLSPLKLHGKLLHGKIYSSVPFSARCATTFQLQIQSYI